MSSVPGEAQRLRQWCLVAAIVWFRMNHSRRCFYCGEHIPFSSGKRSMDHVIPLAKGGSDKKPNRVPCCIPCNRAKKDATLEEFRALRFAGKDIEFYGEQAYRVGGIRPVPSGAEKESQ